MPRRPRRTAGRNTSPLGQRNPRNMDQNRAASVRGNNRPIGSFQGGLSLERGMAPQQAGPPSGGAPRPTQNDAGSCPAGMQPATDPITGQMTCKPAPNGPGQARPVGGGAGRIGGRGAGTSISNRGNTYREGS